MIFSPALELKILEHLPLKIFKYRQLFLFKKFYELAFNIPFYRKIYEEAGLKLNSINSLSDISKIPIVSKGNFKNTDPKDFINNLIDRERIYYKKTSGSTGEPVEFARDKKYLSYVKAFYYLTYKWLDVPLNAKRTCLKSPDGSKRFWESDATLYINFKELQKEPIKFINQIKDFNPLVIESHPSYLVFLGHLLKKNHLSLKVPCLISYGEQLFDSERKFLSEIFKSEVSSFYGLNEVANLGSECEVHEGFHINPFCLVEIVDGEVVVTSFINEIMPLIRYRTGDLGQWILDPCMCGCAWPRLQLFGRRNDTIELANGKKIFSFFFNEIFNKYVKELKQYQVIQQAKNKFLIKIVPAALFNKNIEKALAASLGSLLGNKAKILISKTDFIDWAAGGKRKYVISEV